MEIEGLSQHLPAWLSADGPNANMVFSSRVRFARNLNGHKFVRIASEEERQEIYNLASNAVSKCDSLKDCNLLPVEGLDALSSKFLVERRLISLDMEKHTGKRGVVVNPGQNLAIMINEEDHLRLQYICAGFNPALAWTELNRIDDELSQNITFAFSQRWGYLTACPTNAGTGIRVSVLIHLPALVLTKNIDKVIQGISQLGLNVRGFYGEGTEVLGNIFQISNQTTMGKKDEDLVETVDKVIQQIIGYENDAAETIMKDAKAQVQDKVWRACGLLRNARLMDSSEFMSISSAVRLGIFLGIIKDVRLQTLNELMTQLQPSHLQMNHGKEMEPVERDMLRAELIRQRLNDAS